MPQLDFSTFAPQIIWLVITFVALYLIMARIALPRIANVIEGRRDRIANDLDEAERLKAQTDTAIAEYEADLAQARGKAHDIAQATRAKITTELERERASLEEDLAAKAAKADAAIAEAKNSAMEQIGVAAGEAAEEIVTLLIGIKPTTAKTSQAVAAAIKS
ncbi:MAG: F0F1 ATP synthase subunit B family protein [Alphaproteobacteria bacterium]